MTQALLRIPKPNCLKKRLQCNVPVVKSVEAFNPHGIVADCYSVFKPAALVMAPIMTTV